MSRTQGKRAFGFCDLTGFRYPLRDLVPQIVNQRPTGLLVGKDVLDVDQPQLQLGRVRTNDDQSLRNPRPDRAQAESRELYAFDPFGAATLNVYLLNFNGASGGLATYDFYQQYVELGARMFGGYINYTFNSVTKKLQLIRDPKGSEEVVLIWTYNAKPEITLLADMQIGQWFKDYMVGACKLIIGEAREKYASIAGPQGGSVLNGSAMKAEGQLIMDKCVEDLREYVDGSHPLSFVIG